MNEFYDAENNRIFCFDEEASPEFWEEHWRQRISSLKYRATPHGRIVSHTRHYLPQGSRILEGGCGLAQEVYALSQAEFSCVGVDFAEETLTFVKQQAPELEVVAADLRSLPFKDNSFDGYWSLGVIEHFPEGFDPIAAEMHRILRPGGYLFLTFPTLSPLCKLKKFLGKYPDISEKNGDLTSFYQFRLDPDLIAKHFQKLGFSVLKKSLFDGTKGFKDEVEIFKTSLQSFYESQNFCVRVVRKIFDLCFSPLCGHMSFIILQKED